MTRKWGARALIISLSIALLSSLGGAVALPASAAGLGLSPSSASSITTLPMLLTTSDVSVAGAYGLSLTGVDPSKPVKVVARGDAYPAAAIWAQAASAGSAPRGAAPHVSVPWFPTTEGRTGTVLKASPTGNEIYYLAVNAPGSFDLVLYQEGSTGDQTTYNPADDGATSVAVHLLAYDLDGHTATTADDGTVFPQFQTDVNGLKVGDSVNFSVVLPELSTVDARGTRVDGKGVLGAAMGGTNGTDGPVRIAFSELTPQRISGPISFSGTQNGSTTYTSTYGPIPAVGRVSAFYSVGGFYEHSFTTDVGVPIDLKAPASVRAGEKIRVTGTADPGAPVAIYVKRAGTSDTDFVYAKTVTAATDGSWSMGTTPRTTTQYQAGVNGKLNVIYNPDVSTTVVNAWLTVKAKALGKGKVQWTVDGHPDIAGNVNVYLGTTRLAHGKSDSKGNKVFTTTSAAGRKTFTIYFTAPGVDGGSTTLTGTVK